MTAVQPREPANKKQKIESSNDKILLPFIGLHYDSESESEEEITLERIFQKDNKEESNPVTQQKSKATCKLMPIKFAKVTQTQTKSQKRFTISAKPPQNRHKSISSSNYLRQRTSESKNLNLTSRPKRHHQRVSARLKMWKRHHLQ